MEDRRKAQVEHESLMTSLNESIKRLPPERQNKRKKLLEELAKSRENSLDQVYGVDTKKIEHKKEDDELAHKRNKVKEAIAINDNMRRSIIHEYMIKFNSEVGLPMPTQEEVDAEVNKRK